MRNILYLIIFLVCAMFYLPSCSCTGDDRGPTEPAPIVCDAADSYLLTREVQDYMRFDSGSYWLYEEVNTQEQERVTVIQHDFSISSRHRENVGKEYCHERGSNKLHWSNHPDYFKYSISFWVTPNSTLGDTADYFTFCYTGITSNLGNSYDELYYRFNLRGSQWVEDNQHGGVISKQDSLVIGTDTYRNLLKLDYPNYNGADEFRQAYWAQGTGLVQFTARDGSTWKVREHVVSQDY